MSEALQVKRPIYPLLGMILAVYVVVIALLGAKSDYCIFFLIGIWALFLLYGYWKACLAILPVAAFLSLILAGLTWVISRDTGDTMAAVNRILALCVGVIPGLALPPALLVRNCSALKLPRMLTLGMMITLNFFPLLGDEVRKVREAMRTRGARSLLSPGIFYRAFLIPLIVRVVNISDTLALSVETRGFAEGEAYSVYRTVNVRPRDVVFVLLVVLVTGLAVAI